MEFKTRKNIIYRINNRTACTYEIDDTPPFRIDQEALDIAIEIALMLKNNIVGELHITRKQYLDGSIPTGFQRTAIVGIEGDIPISNKTVRMIQLSIEEDSCREVSDVGHWRTYQTDRLGMPLIEMVTYPDMLTPDEAAEAGHYLRFLARASGKVRTGIGAARQDVNVSVTGGTRVEIKGVQHIRWIPELTHNEAYRQKALLTIKESLGKLIGTAEKWDLQSTKLSHLKVQESPIPKEVRDDACELVAINLPGFKGLLSHFTQPGKSFLNELSDRLKVVACLEKPNVLSSDAHDGASRLAEKDAAAISGLFANARSDDAQLLLWGPAEDMETAIDTIRERCKLAFEGVPNETRKSLPDGTTLFERVLPGPDRMYPDTDSAPIPIEDAHIERIREGLALEVSVQREQLREWEVPEDCHEYILRRNLMPMMRRTVEECEISPRLLGTLLGHRLKRIQGVSVEGDGFSFSKIYALIKYLQDLGLTFDLIPVMLEELYTHPKMVFESILTTVGFKKKSEQEILAGLPVLSAKFDEIRTSPSENAKVDWIMGRLRPLALGNMNLSELRSRVEKEINHV